MSKDVKWTLTVDERPSRLMGGTAYVLRLRGQDLAMFESRRKADKAANAVFRALEEGVDYNDWEALGDAMMQAIGVPEKTITPREASQDERVGYRARKNGAPRFEVGDIVGLAHASNVGWRAVVEDRQKERGRWFYTLRAPRGREVRWESDLEAR